MQRADRARLPVSAENTAAPDIALLARPQGWTLGHKLRALGGLLLLLAMAGFLARYLLVQPAPSPPASRFRIDPPEGHSLAAYGVPALSPDGSKLTVMTDTAGSTALWLRPLSALTFQQLPGTEGVEPLGQLAWSADSRYLLFVAGGKIRKLDTQGGLPQTLCDAKGMAVGAWGPDGTVLLTQNLSGSPHPGPIQELDPEDCSLKPVTRVDSARYDFGHQWPRFLPDGRHFLYAGLRSDRRQDVLLGILGSETSRILVRNASDPRYVEPGYLFFQRAGFLFAQPFDPGELRLTGEPLQVVAQQLNFGGMGGKAVYDVSSGGVLVYQEQQISEGRLLVRDSSGRQLEALEQPGVWMGVRAAPGGRKLVAGKAEVQTHNSDLWIYDRASGNWERASFDSSTGEHWGVWSPDGKTIVYAASVKTNFNLYRTSAHAPYQAVVLLESNLDKLPTDFSSDGRFLLYTQVATSGEGDLWVLPMAGDGAPRPLTQTPFDERSGRFSPDGRWIAYSSDQSGRQEVYVRSFPGPGGERQISLRGGRNPEWSRDGRRIYYLTWDGKLMEIPLRAGAPAPTGPARFLFSLPGEESEYEVLGEREFLINPQGDRWSGPPTVLLNWTSTVDRKGNR